MDRRQHDSQPWPSHWQHELQTESRITRLEITTEDQGETLEEHEQRHDDQDAWNKGFMVALAGLGAGLAHAKAADFLEILIGLLQRLKS